MSYRPQSKPVRACGSSVGSVCWGYVIRWRDGVRGGWNDVVVSLLVFHWFFHVRACCVVVRVSVRNRRLGAGEAAATAAARLPPLMLRWAGVRWAGALSFSVACPFAVSSSVDVALSVVSTISVVPSVVLSPSVVVVVLILLSVVCLSSLCLPLSLSLSRVGVSFCPLLPSSPFAPSLCLDLSFASLSFPVLPAWCCESELTQRTRSNTRNNVHDQPACRHLSDETCK